MLHTVLQGKEAAWIFVLLDKCKATAIVLLIQGVFNLLSDVYILALPLLIIWKLNLERKKKKKIGFAVVFMSVGFGIIASTLGLYYKVRNGTGSDPTWDVAKAYICVYVMIMGTEKTPWLLMMSRMTENYVTIIVSCTPAVSSFWSNVVVKSAAFLSLQSYFRLGRLGVSSERRSIRFKMFSSAKLPDSESLSHLQNPLSMVMICLRPAPYTSDTFLQCYKRQLDCQVNHETTDWRP